VPGVLGAIILYAVVAALAWLLTLTWAVIGVPLRVFRLVTLAVLAAVATTKIL
jgi:hypothetical protein